MKKITLGLLGLTTLALASCGAQLTPEETAEKNASDNIAQAGESVSVHYTGTFDDGEQFDSSLDRGTPLSFTVAAGQMIAGFDAAVEGMKIGEKKTIKLAPADAYGEEYIENTISKNAYQESITQDAEIDILLGKVEDIMDIATASQFFETLEVGEVIERGGATAEITAKTDTDLTVKTEDPNAPFYGAEVVVGATADLATGGTVEILSIDGNIANIQITPELEVLSETDTHLTIKQKNTHPLAGKTLNFDIELVEIK